MKKVWKDIEGYNGIYQVSNFGKIYSNYKGGRVLKPKDNGKGYLFVILYIDGIAKNHYVHRLVAKAFIPNLKDKPEVNHKDAVRDNNMINNLEWVTPLENVRHGYELGFMKGCQAKGSKQGSAKLKEKDIPIIRSYISKRVVSKENRNFI